MKLTEDRASVQDTYLHNGKEIVTFHPPLTLEEWEQVLLCQEKAAKYDVMITAKKVKPTTVDDDLDLHGGGDSGEKRDGKKESKTKGSKKRKES